MNIANQSIPAGEREGRPPILDPLPIPDDLVTLLAGWAPLDDCLPPPADPMPVPREVF
jgi:hypothetical protein